MKTLKHEVQHLLIISLFCSTSCFADFTTKNSVVNLLDMKAKASLTNLLLDEHNKIQNDTKKTENNLSQSDQSKPESKKDIASNNAIDSQNNQAMPIVQAKTMLRPQIGIINCLSQPNLAMSEILELMQAVEKAVCFNPETNSAWVQAKIQAAQLGISQASFYPQISSSANYDWGKDDYQVKNRNDLSYDTNTRRYGLSVQANWLLYDFGTRKAQVNEAEKLLAMSLSQQNQILQETILKTIIAYYQIIQFELKFENVNQLLKFSKENYNIAHARYLAGVGIKSDELQMSANLAKAQADLTKLNGDLKIAKGNLAALMGEPSYQEFQVNSHLKIPIVLDLKNIHVLIAESEQIHPKFKAARLAVEAAQEKVKSTKSSQYPIVSLLSNLNNSKQLGESPFANNSQRIQAGIQVSLPIFDGFNHKNQNKIAQENLKLKQLAEEQIKLQNNADIWKSYNELQAMHENLNALKNLNESATTALEVVQGRYKAGVGNILEVVNAQNVFIEARLNYSTALTEFLVIRYQLLANIGKLNIWSEQNTPFS